ncbi:MAG: peptidoglycan DD-metalloendopeptidase family protein [Lewinellaceae bacterium]|nr:peptidoglycan DD-metalloendopeptidase family protein [Lewinellaceae bacterium]
MKKSPVCLLLCIFSPAFSAYAQNTPSDTLKNSGAFPEAANDAANPCITPQQYAAIEQKCAENTALLGIAGSEQKIATTTALNWPLKPAIGFTDCSYYAIGAYVDHNANAGAMTDYNCGAKTYDGHGGTDIGIPPFPFYKMDHDYVEVIAAAAGTIIDKGDGNFDKNCSVNNLPANYVVVQHPDGSRALYWHMKKNSVTAKVVGQSVVAGEYLGVVGSSGSSSGPHLHFEVWSGNTSGTRIDPYAGSCNALNATSWWAAQKPYTEPAVVKISVHTTDIVVPGCPVTETPNESSCYALPFQGPGLPPGSAKFYVFMRNETIGMTGDVSILNPNGSTFNTWTYSSTNNNSTSWRAWTKPLPNTAGTYTFRATYNGMSCTQTFDIVHPLISANGTTLSSNYASGNQWYWNGNIIPGATAPMYTATQTGNYTVAVTTANGCMATSAIFTFMSTGTDQLIENDAIAIVPNPNSGQFTITVGDSQTAGIAIEIYNLSGEKVLASDSLQPGTGINISDQPNGIYVVRMRSKRGTQVIRVLKM